MSGRSDVPSKSSSVRDGRREISRGRLVNHVFRKSNTLNRLHRASSTGNRCNGLSFSHNSSNLTHHGRNIGIIIHKEA